MSIVAESFRLTGLFEAELLVELLMRYWRHPLADDAGARSCLLENAVQSLQMALEGQVLIDGLQPENTNFVAAVWHGEWLSLEQAGSDETPEIRSARRLWIDRLRHALPSCFCDPDLLD